MNITYNKEKLQEAIQGIPTQFREKLIDVYIEIKKRYLKSFYNDEYDAVGISSGKFCEIVIRILQQEIFNKYTPFDKHMPQFPNEINRLSQSPSESANESIRIIIPRALLLIYTLRNKRGIGHIGGDIEANLIDIGTIVKIVDWVVCELIRIFHNLPLSEAQIIVNSLNLKILPDMWVIDGEKRILKEGFDFKTKTLFLLYTELDNAASVNELFSWTEYSNISLFKSRVLSQLHSQKLIEYNVEKSLVTISPKGISYIEDFISKT